MAKVQGTKKDLINGFNSLSDWIAKTQHSFNLSRGQIRYLLIDKLCDMSKTDLIWKIEDEKIKK